LRGEEERREREEERSEIEKRRRKKRERDEIVLEEKVEIETRGTREVVGEGRGEAEELEEKVGE
jgi:hypothetical protein